MHEPQPEISGVSRRASWVTEPRRSAPRILFTDGGDARVRGAIGDVAARGLARPLVLGSDTTPPPPAIAGVELIDPHDIADRGQLVDVLARERAIDGRIASRLLERPAYLALALLRHGRADAVVAGVASPTRDVLLACEMTLGRRPGMRISSGVFVMDVPAIGGAPERALLFADCAVHPNPSADELAEIAVQAADACPTLLGQPARVAMLSFSTAGSAAHPDVDKIVRATALARARRPDVVIEGEIQADAALDPGVAAHKLDRASGLGGGANVLVFPDLDAANIGYKLVHTLAGAGAYGVFLLGHPRPVVKLSRGATQDDVVGACALLGRLIEGSVEA